MHGGFRPYKGERPENWFYSPSPTGFFSGVNPFPREGSLHSNGIAFILI